MPILGVESIVYKDSLCIDSIDNSAGSGCDDRNHSSNGDAGVFGPLRTTRLFCERINRVVPISQFVVIVSILSDARIIRETANIRLKPVTAVRTVMTLLVPDESVTNSLHEILLFKHFSENGI